MNSLEQKTILLVEDDMLIANAGIRTINKVGYEAITVNSGEEAVETALTNDKISLILMDINLGRGIDGKQAAIKILEKKNIPIVFLTSHFEKEFVEKVKEISRYGYVIKNSSDFVLKTSIEMAFELFEANNTIKKKISELEASEEYLAILLQSVCEGVILTDINGCIKRMNNTAETLTGWSITEALNKKYYEIFKTVNGFSRTPGKRGC
jgi:CheY-like chemotaxis protein